MRIFNVVHDFQKNSDLNLDLTSIQSIGVRSEQSSSRESRGSISFTDYYSNEDGQILNNPKDDGSNITNKSSRIEEQKTVIIDNIDEDEDHTLTLRQTEEQKKQNIKLIFGSSKEDCYDKFRSNIQQPSCSYKKIGR